MKTFVKQQIQRHLVKKRHTQYDAKVTSQTVPYDMWIDQRLKEQQEIPDSVGPAVDIWCFHEVDCKTGFYSKWEASSAEYMLFTFDKGALVPHAIELTQHYLAMHPDVQIGYGDETEYLKPGWSPDLLRSLFYFGNVYMIHRTLLEKVKSRIDECNFCGKSFLYHLVLCCIEETGTAQRIPYILYDNRKNRGDLDWGYEEVYEEVKKLHFTSEKLNHGVKTISVIIPSKDNPSVLSHCIHSLLEITDFKEEQYQMQVIVVDNGSNPENRKKIERMQSQLKEEFSFSYHYCPMPFHFSRMCNLGAKLAKGDYFLFFNDDMEVVQGDWLCKLVEKVQRADVGVVGAKLLYPDGERIQHLGISSIHLGPAHKLQFASDQQEHYHRYNRSCVNVLAVTGACLMIRKELFEQIGGFDEALQVAFNDVELCFAAHKLGYHNVCCNDTFLYHHESLSRGYDAGMEKIKRLHGERDYLYQKYPEYWNDDPYYNPLLVSDILDKGFEAGNRYLSSDFRELPFAEPVLWKEDFPSHWYNQCLYMGVEFAGDFQQWQSGIPGGGDYYIQGWSYAVHVDNSRYEKKIVLQCLDSDEKYVLSPIERYRPDMEEKLPYIDHPALCGVEVIFRQGTLQSGTYLIGYLWQDTASRQRLLGFTGETITIR